MSQPPVRRPPVVIEPNRVPIDQFAQVGDTVFWFFGGDPGQPARVAIVMKSDGDRCDLKVIEPGVAENYVIDGCIHGKSRRLTEGQKNLSGTWFHKPETIVVRRLLISGGSLTFDGVTLKVAEPKAESKQEQNPS